MSDELNFGPLFEGDEDPELKEAAENFFKALQHKTDREAQRAIEKWPTDVLRNKIIQIAVARLQEAAPNLVAALAVLKFLGLASSVELDEMIEQHCELQVEILKRYDIEMPNPAEAIQTLFDMESKGVNDFIKEHAGGHAGCVIDEYRKRMEDDNTWPDDIDVIG